jgi:hypothetical protein
MRRCFAIPNVLTPIASASSVPNIAGIRSLSSLKARLPGPVISVSASSIQRSWRSAFSLCSSAAISPPQDLSYRWTTIPPEPRDGLRVRLHAKLT